MLQKTISARSKIIQGKSGAFSEGLFLMMLWGKAGLYLEVGTAKPYLPYCFHCPCESEQISCYEKGKRGASLAATTYEACGSLL